MKALTNQLIMLSKKLCETDDIIIQGIKHIDFILCLKEEENVFFYKVSKDKISVINCEKDKADVTIAGTTENWLLVLQGLDGGIHRAFRHEVLHFYGNYFVMLNLWKVIWRIGENLSKVYLSQEKSKGI